MTYANVSNGQNPSFGNRGSICKYINMCYNIYTHMNLSRTNIHVLRTDAFDIPAIRAAIVVLFFFAAAFLNYGFLLFALAAYGVAGIRTVKKGKTSKLQKCIQFYSFEVAVLLFGVMAELCFRAWLPSLSAAGAFPRTVAWLALAAVLLSTKFILITHAAEAFSQPKWFAEKAKDSRSVLVALGLLVAALALLIGAYAGPAAERIPAFFLKALVPGIV